MTLIILLFLIGMLLLSTEIIAPGIVLGSLGAASMVAGVAVAFQRYGFSGGSLALLVALVALAVTCYLEFVVLPKTKLAKKLSMSHTVDSTSQPPLAELQEVLGQTCEAATTLAPSGYVVVAGKRYEAFSRSGYAEKGASLRVVGLDNFRLIVTKP